MSELLYGTSNVLIYFVLAVCTVLLLRLLVQVYDEVFRKILHFVLLGSILVWTVSFHTWWIEVVSVVGFVVIVYPILHFFERFHNYSQITTERRNGELKSSLVLVFVMFAIVITVAQGIFDDRYLTLASIYAWGVGDAFAALIGKRFGVHHIRGHFLSGEKTLEGTLAMFLCSFASVLIILSMRGGMSLSAGILISILTGAVSAVCELYTKNGMDTFTCPLVSLAALIGLMSIFGGV